jgi:hypothetical protein
MSQSRYVHLEDCHVRRMTKKTISHRVLHFIENVGYPVKTAEVVARCGYDRNNPRQSVWCALAALHKHGLISKSRAKGGAGKPCAMWSAAQ